MASNTQNEHSTEATGNNKRTLIGIVSAVVILIILSVSGYYILRYFNIIGSGLIQQQGSFAKSGTPSKPTKTEKKTEKKAEKKLTSSSSKGTSSLLDTEEYVMKGDSILNQA